MSADIEADLLFCSLRERIYSKIEDVLTYNIKNLASHKIQENKSLQPRVEKLIYEVALREIESSLTLVADDLAQKIDAGVSERVRKLESELSSVPANDVLLEKLEILESKLSKLETCAFNRPSVQEPPSNPYVEIEHRARGEDWEGAWRLAVEVYNGVDFMVHLMGSPSPEDFFSANPVIDPLLALQICINSCREIMESEKSVSVKLEIISELVLGLTNPQRINLAHPFAQLRDLICQVSNKLQSPRVREIQKIIVATERLLTPPVSIQGTPMLTGARFFSNNTPGPRNYP
jgi:hypothetical protein